MDTHLSLAVVAAVVALAGAAPAEDATPRPGNGGAAPPAALTLERETFLPGETVSVKVTARAEASTLRLVDSHGRLLDSIELPASAEGADAALRLRSVVCPGATVELCSGGKVLAARAIVVACGDRLGRGYLVVADLRGMKAEEDLLRAMLARGVRVALTDSVEEARRLAEAGLSVVVGDACGSPLLRLSPEEWTALRTAGADVRPACPDAPLFRVEMSRRTGEFLEKAGSLPLAGMVPATAPSVGCGYEPHGLCRCGNSLHALREHLRGVHGSVEALAGAWGVSFHSWDEAVPLSEAGMLARMPGRTLPVDASIAQWLEHRMLCDGSLAAAIEDACRRMRLAQKPPGGPPLVLLGAEAPAGYGPPRLTELLGSFDVSGAQRGRLPDALALWFGPGRGRPLGGLEDPSGPEPVEGLLRGEVGVLAPPGAFRPGAPARAGLDRALDLQGGLGDLFAEAVPARPRVSVLVSDESAAASWLLDRWADPAAQPPRDAEAVLASTSYMKALAGWTELLDDLGVEYEFVSPAAVERGRLGDPAARVLILPRALALSAACASAVALFVRSGGAAVADCACGVLDETGRRRDRLDGVFGVRHGDIEFAERWGEAVPLERSAVKFAPADSGARRAYARASLAGIPAALRGVSEAGGEASGFAAGIPVMLCNSAGAGRAYYLNLAVSRYPAERLRPGGAGLRSIAGQLLAGARAACSVDVRSDSRGDLFCVRTWTLGRTTLYGVTRRAAAGRAGDRPARVSVRLPEAAFVSEPARGLRHGQVTAVEAEVPASGTFFLAAEPVEAEAVGLDLLGGSRPLEFELSVSLARGEKPGLRVVRVWAQAPSGKRPAWYDRTCVLQGATFTGSIPFCLSDEPGMWRICARDLASGREAIRTFILDR